ncbi:PTS sugar transporter subunit IIC [Escherichia coli]
MTHGFEVAGGILPAVGFGFAAARNVQSAIYPYLIAGFPVCLLHPCQQPVAGCRTGCRLCGV